MYTVTREIHFSYGHRLFNHPGKCAHLHGHSGRVQIEVSSEKLDSRGMVMDFEQIKESVGLWIQQALDHKMILWEQDPIVPVLQKAGEMIVLVKDHPTAEVLAQWIFEEARNKRLPVSKVTLWETPNSFASFHE